MASICLRCLSRLFAFRHFWGSVQNRFPMVANQRGGRVSGPVQVGGKSPRRGTSESGSRGCQALGSIWAKSASVPNSDLLVKSTDLLVYRPGVHNCHFEHYAAGKFWIPGGGVGHILRWVGVYGGGVRWNLQLPPGSLSTPSSDRGFLTPTPHNCIQSTTCKAGSECGCCW
jgi:hypothetical protein